MIFTWIGATVSFLLSLGLVILGIAWMIEGLSMLWDRWCWKHEAITARQIGCRIINESYWFGEDQSAMNALLAIGEELRDEGGYRMSGARDKWRSKNEALKKDR